MTPSIASRLLLRRSALIRTTFRSSKRYASTTEKATEKASEAVSKAKETASNVQSKASEGLSKVTSSASSAASGTAGTVSKTVSGVTSRVGRLVAVVESTVPQVVYYSRVGLELVKIVAHGQKIGLPSSQQFSNAFQPILNAVRNPSSLMQSAQSTAAHTTPEGVLSRVRNMDSTQWATAGVIFAEVLGFFTIGEMAGRMKFVGYRGEVHHAH